MQANLSIPIHGVHFEEMQSFHSTLMEMLLTYPLLTPYKEAHQFQMNQINIIETHMLGSFITSLACDL